MNLAERLGFALMGVGFLSLVNWELIVPRLIPYLPIAIVALGLLIYSWGTRFGDGA
jgi:hypothetical protein